MEEKRTLESYEIVQSFKIGGKETVLGISPTNVGQEYLVANYENNGILERYVDALVGNDYLEIAKIYVQRISERITELEQEREAIKVDLTPYDSSNCDKVSYDKNIINSIVVIKADVFCPEYQRSIDQLQLCTGGNGARGNDMGRACFCKNLYTGKEARYNREDILGVLPKEKLPDWAKEGLEKIQNQRKKANRDSR